MSTGTAVSEAQLLGRRIRAARVLMDLHQKEFGERVGLSQSQVTDIERGRRAPTALELFAIARESGQPIEFFTTDLGRQPQGSSPVLTAA